MINLKAIIFLLFVLMIHLIHAQQPLDCAGKMIKTNEGSLPICFKRVNNGADSTTKYTIFYEGAEIYEVGFQYFSQNNKVDSVFIYFIDKKTIEKTTRGIKLKPCYSQSIIQDFEPNIEPIDTISPRTILFSIDFDKDRFGPFITLYQFQGIDADRPLFILQSVPQTVLDIHHENVNDWIRCWTEITNFYKTADSLKGEMLKYKDSIIEAIKQECDFKRGLPAELTASPEMQKAFQTKMDSIILTYYKNVFWFTDDLYDVQFRFECDGYGKMHIDNKTVDCKNREDKLNRFNDSFQLWLKPKIEAYKYPTRTIKLDKPSLLSDFDKRFDLYKITKWAKAKPINPHIFDTVIQIVQKALTSYLSVEINVATKYSYAMKYESKNYHVTWKYQGKNENEPKIKIKSTQPEADLKQDIIDLIKSKNLKPPKENQSEVCKIIINEKEKYKDIKDEKEQGQ